MHYRSLVIILASLLPIVGCQLSPYERAEREYKQAEGKRLHAERKAEQERRTAERDEGIFRRDIRAAAEKLIVEANREAAKRDGVTYVDIKQFKRVVYFVPASMPLQEQKEPDVIVDGTFEPPPPPDDAVAHEWTNRFALAQQFTYRYTLEKITDIRPVLKGELLFEAKAVFRMDYQKPSAKAGTPKRVPKPPRGMRLWSPKRPCLHFGFGIGDGKEWRHLPHPDVPPGERAEKVTDPLARQAVAAMAKAKVEPRHMLLEAAARCYRSRGVSEADGEQTSKWSIFLKSQNTPAPHYFSWYHGLPKSMNDAIYPEDIRKRPAGGERGDTKSAP